MGEHVFNVIIFLSSKLHVVNLATESGHGYMYTHVRMISVSYFSICA